MANRNFPAGDWKLVRVQGTDRQRGRQHAEQVGEAARNGMPFFYARLLSRLVSEKPAALGDRAVLWAVRKAIDPVLVKTLLRQVPSGARDRISGFAESAQLSQRELELALVLPDLLPIVQGAFCRVFPGRFAEVAPAALFGCSSFVSRAGGFLVGRNLDFPGVGYWDRYPVIQHSKPEGALQSISFTSAGVPLGGITGVNEQKIYVAIHQHYGCTTSLGGTLPFIVAEKILDQARSLDDALGILERAKFSSSWAFVLADGKTRNAAICEVTARERGMRTLQTRHLSHANFFQTPQCKPREFATTMRMNWDNQARAARLDTLVDREADALTAPAAAQILSDHWDPYWDEEKVVNRTISQAFNIQSVVLDLENLQGWLGTGPSPIHLGEYKKYDLASIFSGGDGVTQAAVDGFRFKDPRKQMAKQALVTSLVDAMDGKMASALHQLEVGLGHQYCEEMALTAAIVAMKQGREAWARETLDKAVAQLETRMKEHGKASPPPEYFEMRLFQGRFADLKGDRAKAQEHYAYVAQSKALQDRNLKRLAKQHKPYGRKQLDRLMLPYSTYAPFN